MIGSITTSKWLKTEISQHATTTLTIDAKAAHQ
jgi:hypothetical protein